ncbi:MAG: PHP domain-containing protein [Bacteroidota bacterium]|jgi:predicted metal-dependent phosphoesterase TrpH
MLRYFKVDLHVHTCLSPCADLKMSPRKITEQAVKNNVDLIAICDHNSAENVVAVQSAAKGQSVVVLAGMEVCTKEEAHVLAIFEELGPALELQELVYRNLHGENDPEAFGLQVIVNEIDEVEGFQDKLLIGAADLSIEEAVNYIHQLDGLAIASHIDRESYSVIGHLGFIPENLEFDALELSRNISYAEARKRFAEYKRYPFIKNSDAHFLNDIGESATEYLLEEPSFGEIKKALRNADGRRAGVV